MWPPQDHANTIAWKWELAQSLDLIVQERTKSAQPKTRLLINGETIQNVMVLKCMHSDTGEHIIIPSKIIRCNWDYLHLHIEGSRWMVQSYIDTLIRLEEWCIFLIGGQIVYTAHTNREKDTWDMVCTYYMLEELM
jgi:hypothetical protein